MRLSVLVTSTAVLWPTFVAAHGDATDHIHPHGETVIPYEALVVLAALTVAVGTIAALWNREPGDRLRAAIRRVARRMGRDA